jgi:hypothetical protein
MSRVGGYDSEPPGQTQQRWKHGTFYGYKIKGCRCDLCSDRVSAYMRGQRATLKEAAAENPGRKEAPRRLSVRSLQSGERVFLVRSLETGAQAVMVTKPYRLTSRERWSWVLNRPVKTNSRRKRNPPRLSA